MSKFVFANSITVDNALTLEVSDDILNAILSGESYTLRGPANTSAALCTDYSTQQLRQVGNSNTCLLVESGNAVDIPTTTTGDTKIGVPITPHPHTIDPLGSPEHYKITSMVTCAYDSLPPTTADITYTFSQLTRLYPLSKQFSFDHMKLLMVIYKQNRVLYYKLISNLRLDLFRTDTKGNQYQFSMRQDGESAKTTREDKLLSLLDGFGEDGSTQVLTTQPTKKPRSSLYSKSTAQTLSSQNSKSSDIIIKKSRINGNIMLSTPNPQMAKSETSISTLFDWTSTTNMSSLTGYDFSSLSNVIQLSKYQLLHQLAQLPVILFENRYSLLSYDLIVTVLNAITDFFGVVRAKYKTPFINPSLYTPVNPITGLNSSTPAFVMSRNFLLHELEVDGICCPLVIMSVLMQFIDWDSTMAMYDPEIINKASENEDDGANNNSHTYQNYADYFSTIPRSSTSSIPNTTPNYYTDFTSFNHHINDLFGFDDSLYENAIAAKTHPILTPTTQPKRNTIVGMIPPIFVLSMSKVLSFVVHDITIQYHAQKLASNPTASNTTANTNNNSKNVPILPHIPLETLFKILRDRLPCVSSMASLFIDLAGSVVIDDPTFTYSKGYHPNYNIGSTITPKYPQSFNLDDYTLKATLHLVQTPTHNPQFVSKFNLLNSPKDRFDYLFKVRKQWPVPALKPFLQGVVVYFDINREKIDKMFKVDDQDNNQDHTVNNSTVKHMCPLPQLLNRVNINLIDALLLKHARAVTTNVMDEAGTVVQTNVTYCSR